MIPISFTITTMKRTFITSMLILAAALCSPGQSSEIKAELKITDVTVYNSGARIFSEKRADVPAGTSTIRFTGITSDLDAGSIQVTAEGAVTILSVNSELDYISGTEQGPALKNLTKQRDALVKSTEKEKMQIEILDKEMQFMQANMKVTGTTVTTKVAELAPVYDYFVAKVTEITQGKKWRTDSIRSWEEQINKINSQIGEMVTQQKRPAGVIAVNLDAPVKSTVLFRISYLTGSAGWYPTYDIRVKNIDSPVFITYKANVYQNSGNDWKEVNLRFSSATPTQSGVLPELSPWWLNIQEPKLMIRGYGTRQNIAADKSMKLEEAVMAEAPAMPLAMMREEAGTTVEFLMGKPFSVPSTGKNFQVDVTSESLPALYSYVAVPKIDPSAHLKARLTNWEQLNLLPGEANVYFEGTFTGKTYLNQKDFSDTLEISLGIDRSISIQRTLDKKLSSTRFLASKTEASKSWKLSVRNNKLQKINLTLTDQLPLSANTDIEVINAEFPGGKLNPGTGEVSWQMEINPSERSEKKIGWTVRYPKGKKVNID